VRPRSRQDQREFSDGYPDNHAGVSILGGVVRYVLAAIALFACAEVCAQTCSATLSWTAPDTNVDGSPLTNLAGYRVYTGTAPRDYTDAVTLSDPAAESFIAGNLEPGTHYFAVTAVNAEGVESSYSNEASKSVANCTMLPDPRPPGQLVVGPDPVMTVYDFVPQTDRAVMLPVGTIAAGTVCIGTEMIVAAGVAYWAVPRAFVTFAGTVRPSVTYARCRMP
jgi:hypothetical protein